MRRPTPALIFSATGLSILLMLLLVTSVSAVSSASPKAQPQAAAAALIQPAAKTAAPTRPPSAAPVTRKAAPTAAPTRKAPKNTNFNIAVPPVVEPVFIKPVKPPYVNDLSQFITAVKGGQPGELRGVMVLGLFALDVVQQPGSDPNWVSPEENQITLFNAAVQNGVLGLLAHNTRAGRDFDALKPGQRIDLVYGDGTVKTYRISDPARYQALEPANPASDLIDLSNGQQMTSGEVFARFYAGNYALVLQTCIERDGDSQWGRLFIPAEPVSGG